MKKSQIKINQLFIFTQHVINPLTGEDLGFDPQYVIDAVKANDHLKAAFLIHHSGDEGPGEDDHWQGAVITDGEVSRDQLCKWFNLPYFLIKHPYIGNETCPWNALVNYSQYCTIKHAYDSKDGKHKIYYDPSDVISTFDFNEVMIKEGKI